jgi:hypothetical protein
MICRRPLKQQVQDTHDRSKQQGRKGIALPKAATVKNEAVRHPIHHHLRRRGAQQPTNHGNLLMTEAKILQHIQEKIPIHHIEGFGDIQLQQDGICLPRV